MNNSLTNTARLLVAGLRALLVLTLVTGVIYPLVVTGIAQAAFHGKANGSEVKSQGKVVGSALIGQQGYSLGYFQGRPANGLGANSVNTRYKLLLSGATNLSADSKTLIKQVDDAKAKVVKDNSVPGYPVKPSDVPADAVTSSGSGLDPDISPAYAQLQVHRVALNNHLSVAAVEKLVDDHTEGRTLGFIGDPRVNVLQLNIALKALVARQ
ncbi:potassium-transporting ATPase subunit C [Streptomyces acidiscabies]|uniref:Potassium-transporting ATPase KdpC subunit n=1 Tax=Streptomyces acidiscabies TaxID=42234 RepID=A0AAP6EGR3_9ACTN|nr:potassium-transporting ATPase subunit C [Streptomyces acidiscabies]MBP5938050.1 potassium-transporting ATPase subunit C [Streptomyces sp. LBUM 1476]MBZ3909058.1 potassium-transporting ATPase subunit C [Streptomyces acidiscabies]MDX2961595.1 potassium-transporting ATPase subunit C [Streptomyces acidiscabies]MDX3016537.1 potassium-transporting ATPase subunit C [Streptomyces acidiscabies]MDX3788558.1 potassium-transporting ATPase subunit C [Streptomyces acidiscabies]